MKHERGLVAILVFCKEPVRTCSIITTTPNALTAPIHDRMPVILPMERRAAWLDQERSVEELQSFLVPYEASGMEAYPVSARVGSAKNDDAGVVAREAQGELFGVMDLGI